ncbi:hypothetical protein KEM52_006313 [Ascosphaera acerosa]|nr:hypothetical protein KEM52_006313 [Ascosphaera acerosa]
MSVRVVARIRPLQPNEREADVILRTASSSAHSSGGSSTSASSPPALSPSSSSSSSYAHPSLDRTQRPGYAGNTVKIAIPKNETQQYSFQFHAVYGPQVTQEDLFEAESHNGATKIDLLMSYYEIYNDKVYDLFEDPDKRTALGLPLREAGGGKTVVVGLTERSCHDLKDFEAMYDQANENRSTGATKLNAHSSRSHAILCVKVVMTTNGTKRISTVSAIDLAGSEDNRRTDNGKERMVESASINRSLFVLAQCVEAISKQQARIPYRESKMTRILSLGQNKGRTVMILNLAPTRSYHLDTLSSLNFANRTKKIEVKDIENRSMPEKPSPQPYKPSYMVPTRRSPPAPAVVKPEPSAPPTPEKLKTPAKVTTPSKKQFSGLRSFRQSFRNSIGPKDAKTPVRSASETLAKPSVRQSVHFTDALKSRIAKPSRFVGSAGPKTPTHSQPPLTPDETTRPSSSPAKIVKPPSPIPECPPSQLEVNLEEKVEAAIATRLKELDSINDSLRRQLREVERRVEEMEYMRTEGLLFLLMAKEHHARGQDALALRFYLLAEPFFPHNHKVMQSIALLRSRLGDGATIIEQQVSSQHHLRGTAMAGASLQEPPRFSGLNSHVRHDSMMHASPTPASKRGHHDPMEANRVSLANPVLAKEILGRYLPPHCREDHMSVLGLAGSGISYPAGSESTSKSPPEHASYADSLDNHHYDSMTSSYAEKQEIF